MTDSPTGPALMTMITRCAEHSDGVVDGEAMAFRTCFAIFETTSSLR